MKKVIVIGGGAAGMMAALISARAGNTVTLIEKNEKLGKKIYITWKGRCHLTNTCDKDDLFKNVVHNSKFMYSAFNAFEAFESLWNFSRAESMSWCSLSVNFEYAFTCCKAVSQKMIIKIRSWCFFILSWCLDKILWWDYYSFWDFQ